MPSNQWSKPKKASPWVLWMAGAVCFVAILISIGGVLIPHSTPSSYLATGGGQSYAIQVGGDQARAGYLACGADYRSVTRKES